MTESEQVQALKAAFPAEPASETLKQRVANLIPLQPVVTGYKFKFRHAFTVLVVLWIGHNIPAAITTWNTYDKRQSHSQSWYPDENGKLRLSMEQWVKDSKFKIHLTPQQPGKYHEKITILTNEMSYTYDVQDKEIQIRKILGNGPDSKGIFLDRLAKVSALFIFRYRDTRNLNRKTEITDQYWKHSSYWSTTDALFGPDPKTPVKAQRKMGKSIEIIERGISISDSTFEPDFPPGVKVVYEPHSKRVSNFWASFSLYMNHYLSGKHL